MADRADLDKFLAAQKKLVAKAKQEYEELFSLVDTSKPEGQAVFSEAYAAYTHKWGEAFSAFGVDWYESLRRGEGVYGGGFKAVMPKPIDVDYVARNARKLLKQAESKSPEWVREQLWVRAEVRAKNMSRYAVLANAAADPKATSFARVPRGRVTCAFCSMLASRGWVYGSAEAAGSVRRFHAHCDCLIVPSFKGKIPKIDGYDPERLYAEYLEARESAIAYGNPGDMDSILEEMKLRLGRYTDSYALFDDPKLRAEQRASISWWERQNLIGGGELGEQLSDHEIVFYEQFMDSGEKFTLIPRPEIVSSQGRASSNDFIWHRADGDFEVEVKSFVRPKYENVSSRIKSAVVSAEEHQVVKDRFIVYSRERYPHESFFRDIGKMPERKNIDVKELYWWDGESLRKMI